MRSPTRPTTAVALAGVLLACSAFAWGSYSSADAKPSSGLTKADVTKIAKKQAKKAITKAAPTLTVGRAKNADKVANQSVDAFGTQVLVNGAAVPLATMRGLSLVGTCPSGTPTITASAAGGALSYETSSSAAIDNNLSSAAVSDPTATGTGMLYYKPPASTVTVTAVYGWSLDINNDCYFYGHLVGG